ncbi:hypothetical protein GCM10007159_10710 [Modicisalibacter luteus]|nr:hypothetical protein GCM10007159_10710 [Halomonas lutea]
MVAQGANANAGEKAGNGQYPVDIAFVHVAPLYSRPAAAWKDQAVITQHATLVMVHIQAAHYMGHKATQVNATESMACATSLARV